MIVICVNAAMLVIGVLVILFSNKIAGLVSNNSLIKKTMQQINLKEKVDEEQRKYYKTKIFLAGAVIAISGIFGLAYSISMKDNRINTLKRPKPGMGVATYNLKAVEKDKSEKINITLSEKKYTSDEAKQICNEAYEKWMIIALNGNKDWKHITGDINFSDVIDGYDVLFEYYPDSDGSISTNGEIQKDNITFENGVFQTQLIVITSLGDYRFQNNLDITIIESEDVTTLEEWMQDYVDSKDDSEEKISLPENVEGEKINFYHTDSKFNWIFIPLGIAGAILVYFVKDYDLKKKLKERHDEMRNDYSEIISMISILQGAGHSIRHSWEKIVNMYEKKGMKRYAYEEMKLAKNKMDNGMSEIQAYREFGKRCGLHEYIKMINILEQNISKGSNEMLLLLQHEVEEANINKITLAKKNAEQCSTKLLVPMIIMLIIVMIILIAPAFMSMNI